MNIAFVGDKEFIGKLTEIILANLENEAFSGKELSRETAVSITYLNKRLRSVLHKSISQFIREVRLQRAMDILQQEKVTAAEVAYKVGFGSPAYFSTCFTEFFGITPGEVKRGRLPVTQENGNDVSAGPEPIAPEPVQPVVYTQIRKKQVWKVVLLVLPALFSVVALYYFFYTSHFSSIETTGESRQGIQEKSIAVLPFINDSNDPENVYFINGVMEAILDNLSIIKDLEVRPRTSVEQYRNQGSKTIPQIGRELDVNYIIEGSGQKIDDQVNLYIQLIEAGSDKHLLSLRYNLKLEDIFNLQSEVALKVASEIKSVITQEEKESIEKPPTTSIAAWEMYSRGFELHNIADMENNIENDKQAKKYFKKAIQLDSTYADPYVQLGWISYVYNEWDSALFYSDKALYFDRNHSNAYNLKGVLHSEKGLDKEAEEAFTLAIHFNPNNASAYVHLASIFFYQGESYKAIKHMLKALQFEKNSIEKRSNLINLWDSFNSIGLYDEGKRYAKKLIALTGDSTYYYWSLLHLNFNQCNYDSVMDYAQKIYRADSLNLGKLLDFHHSYFLGNIYLNLREYKEAYRILEKYTASMTQQGRKIQPNFYLGYIYLQNGKKKEANFHFEGSINYRLQVIEHVKPAVSCAANLGLTFIYAGIGEKEKALEHLRVVNSRPSYFYNRSQITRFKISPLVDCIRNEPEYGEFLKNAETRYLEEHNNVEKLLRAEGLLETSIK